MDKTTPPVSTGRRPTGTRPAISGGGVSSRLLRAQSPSVALWLWQAKLQESAPSCVSLITTAPTFINALSSSLPYLAALSFSKLLLYVTAPSSYARFSLHNFMLTSYSAPLALRECWSCGPCWNVDAALRASVSTCASVCTCT